MPGDLNLKKSWNPALLKNQKKVWEREQEALKEYQAIKQKSKEIAQEREKEEMIRLQYGNDSALLPSKHKLELNKLGWMYDGPKDQPKEDESGFREVEEDFLANTKEMESLVHGSRAVKSKPSRFEHVASTGAAKAAPSVLNDDPLLMIRRQRSVQAKQGSNDRHRSSRREDERERERRDKTREGHSDRSDKHRSSRGRSSRDRSSRDRSSRDRSSRDRSSRDRSSRDRSSRDSSSRDSSSRDNRHASHGSRSHRDRSPDSSRLRHDRSNSDQHKPRGTNY